MATPRLAREVLVDGTDVTNDTDRAILLRVANAQLEMATQMGTLAREVALIRERLRGTRRQMHSLSGEVDDTRSFELRSLRARNKWIMGIMSGVIVILAAALILHVVGWRPGP